MEAVIYVGNIKESFERSSGFGKKYTPTWFKNPSLGFNVTTVQMKEKVVNKVNKTQCSITETVANDIRRQPEGG